MSINPPTPAEKARDETPLPVSVILKHFFQRFVADMHGTGKGMVN
jgi:hypothetical protein